MYWDGEKWMELSLGDDLPSQRQSLQRVDWIALTVLAILLAIVVWLAWNFISYSNPGA